MLLGPDDSLKQLVELGIRWVAAERDLHRPSGRRLLLDERSRFEPFFESRTLDQARIALVPLINDPPFYSQMESIGIPRKDLIPFSEMGGITFVDTILVAQSKNPPGTRIDSLLFHELVHVVQYESLGIDEFVKRYVYGWNENGRAYAKVPLERAAYELQERFEAMPTAGFSVFDEVRKKLILS